MMTDYQATLEQFKSHWGLTYAQLAATLGYSEQGVKQWFFSPGSKQQRSPQPIVLIAIELLNEKWQRDGKPKFF